MANQAQEKETGSEQGPEFPPPPHDRKQDTVSDGGHPRELTEETASNRNVVNNHVHIVNTPTVHPSHVNNNTTSKPKGPEKNVNNQNKQLICWYTNADTLTNKLPELSSRVKNAKTTPSIIAITEIKPKNYRYPLTAAELQLDNYDIFTKNIPGNKGRGIAIYTARELKAHEISITTIFEEHLTVSIKLENDEELTITCIYRSPSSTPDNNSALCRLIKEIDGRPEQLKIILGDFNYPSITWSNLYYSTSDNNVNKDPDNFKEAIIETYLQQFVDCPTRARGPDNPSCIDWVSQTMRLSSTESWTLVPWEAATTQWSKQTSMLHPKTTPHTTKNTTTTKETT